MVWSRPATVPVGQVWLRFQGRNRDGNPEQNMFQVRDVEPDHKDACIELMLNAFLRDEPLCKALGLGSDPVSVSTVRRDWERFVEQGVSVACYTELDGKPQHLVGINILVVKEKGEKEEFYSADGEAWQKLLKTLTVAEDLVDVYEHYGVQKYLSSSGLTVHPVYRGQNIGARIFEARKPICKALGLTVSATVFTAKTSQVLAAKCGYKLLASLNYDDMRKYGVVLTHPIIKDNPTAELKGIKFE